MAEHAGLASAPTSCCMGSNTISPKPVWARFQKSSMVTLRIMPAGVLHRPGVWLKYFVPCVKTSIRSVLLPGIELSGEASAHTFLPTALIEIGRLREGCLG